MKPGLQRIGETLAQLHPQPGSQPGSQSDGSSEQSGSNTQIISFKISSKTQADSDAPTVEGLHLPPAQEATSPTSNLSGLKAPLSTNPPTSQSSQKTSRVTANHRVVSKRSAISFKVPPKSLSQPSQEAIADTVPPFPIAQDTKTPNLPKFKLPNFSNSRHVTNPEFSLGLLKEMQGIVIKWQKELQQVLLQVQDLYLEGPVIDGWLESHPPSDVKATGATTLRHAEIDRLTEYVEELCQTPTSDAFLSKANPETSLEPNSEMPRTGYRLCGLDADGQLWSRPCPAEQVPKVSLAIARYQKLRQLLARKHHLESRLDQFSKALIDLHSNFLIHE
jgi:hypothetical protein